MVDNQKTPKTIRLDDIHWNLIEGLTPFYGSSEPEVARNIILMWLHENLGSETIKDLEDADAIKLRQVKNKISRGKNGKK